MKTLKNIVTITVVILTLTSCSTDSPTEIDNADLTTTNQTTQTTQTTDTVEVTNDWVMADQVLEVVNEHRMSIGLNPLEAHIPAEDKALEHTAYMINNNKMSHDNFLTRSDILKSQGAKKVSENVAYGYRTAQEVLQGWLNSPSHKEALEGNFTHTGIGVAKNSNGIYYYTQLFEKL